MFTVAITLILVFTVYFFKLKVGQKKLKHFVPFVAVWKTFSILRASSSPILTLIFYWR